MGGGRRGGGASPPKPPTSAIVLHAVDDAAPLGAEGEVLQLRAQAISGVGHADNRDDDVGVGVRGPVGGVEAGRAAHLCQDAEGVVGIAASAQHCLNDALAAAEVRHAVEGDHGVPQIEYVDGGLRLRGEDADGGGETW